MAAMLRLVIDTDPGVDDALAILLACAQPQAEIVALTTVAGNVALPQATRNALTLMDLAGRPAPVFPGSADALVTPTPRRATSHGRDGLGDCGYTDAAPTRPAEPEHAALALLRLAHANPGQLTLAAIGPLTNVALALGLDPGLPAKFERLIVMGGAIHAHGNSWERAAEFNFYCDPEAAALVFQRWPGLWLVPWETSVAHDLPPALVRRLAQGNSPGAEFLRRASAGHLVNTPEGGQSLSAPDLLALAIAVAPDLVTRAEPRYLEIELAGRFTRGQTVVDWYDLTGRAPNTNVVMEVDRDRYYALLQSAFALRLA
jgi:purine nucleosidase